MFVKLEEFVYRMFGAKTLSINEVQKVADKAVEYDLIYPKQLKINEPISTTGLLDTIRKLAAKNELFNKEENKLKNIGEEKDIENIEQLKKLESALRGFFEYEKIRMKKTPSNYSKTVIVSICIAFFVGLFYFSYIPEPY
ncbi:hypothetical protein NUSPORA_01620 [Nucleospora cyclopteri]